MSCRLSDQVRMSCRYVAQKARHVRIDLDRIIPYVETLPLAESAIPAMDPQCHYLNRGEDTVAFILTLDTVNFGSGYFPFLKKFPGMSGYFTVAKSLTDRWRTDGPLSAETLSRLTSEDCRILFGQDPDNAPIKELMRHFAAALNDLGRCILERYGGRFSGLVEEADFSTQKLVRLLIGMPYFNDVAGYAGMPVAFFKRAQLTASDLSTAFSEKGPGYFTDLHCLTIFADNLVPHVLKTDGILSYEPGLSSKILRHALIPAGSEEEVEIRACAVHAAELIKSACNKNGCPVTAMALDYLLWNRGQHPAYKVIPRHRTRSIFY